MSAGGRSGHWRRAGYLAGALLAAVALIGLAHTQAGRPLLALLRGAPGCPLDPAAQTPAAIEARRTAGLVAQRGERREHSRPALGFELGRTHRSEVLARVQAQGLRCDSRWNGAALRCMPAPGAVGRAGAPSIEDLHLQFDPTGTLVAVDVLRARSTREQALQRLSTLEAELGKNVGPATAEQGDRSARYLRTPLHRAALEYHYQGYVAEVSATNLGSRGVRIREQYQRLPQPNAHATRLRPT